MPDLIEQGKTITLDAFFEDTTNAAIDPDVEPQVSILDPSGATVVDLDVPTRVTTGHWQYKYAVPEDADLGGWAAKWFATLNTVSTEDEDVFTVVEAGTLTGGSMHFGSMTGVQTCSPWASTADVLPDYAGDTAVLERCVGIAGDILYELTGRRWSGQCRDSIRPLAQWRAYDGPPRWWPSDTRGAWGYCSCHRGRENGCASLSEIKLPGTPVNPSSITVTLDGEDFTEFALHDRRFLVRTDGHGWPCCQDLKLPLTEPKTFGIAYGFGLNPPPGGSMSAAQYGYELALSMDPALIDKCTLPRRVTNITRQGVTKVVLDPMTIVKDGLVGLPLVDGWVTATNLGRKRRRATVLVPGQTRSARRIS